MAYLFVISEILVLIDIQTLPKEYIPEKSTNSSLQYKYLNVLF